MQFEWVCCVKIKKILAALAKFSYFDWVAFVRPPNVVVRELESAALGSFREAVRTFAESRAAPSDRGSAAVCANVSLQQRVRFTLANTGERFGEEVAQVYAQGPIGATVLVRAWKRLIGFTKVGLAPSESRTISLELQHADIALHDEAVALGVTRGVYNISLVGSSDSDRLSVAVELC